MTTLDARLRTHLLFIACHGTVGYHHGHDPCPARDVFEEARDRAFNLRLATRGHLFTTHNGAIPLTVLTPEGYAVLEQNKAKVCVPAYATVAHLDIACQVVELLRLIHATTPYMEGQIPFNIGVVTSLRDLEELPASTHRYRAMFQGEGVAVAYAARAAQELIAGIVRDNPLPHAELRSQLEALRHIARASLADDRSLPKPRLSRGELALCWHAYTPKQTSDDWRVPLCEERYIHYTRAAVGSRDLEVVS